MIEELARVQGKFLGPGDIAAVGKDGSTYYPTEFNILADTNEAVLTELLDRICASLAYAEKPGAFESVVVTHRYGAVPVEAVQYLDGHYHGSFSITVL